MNPEIVKKTQDTLGKIIKKPPLTEKLLGKPPFRFLHDIFTEVIRTSGFLKGLFNKEEMDSKNVTAKEDKLLFLQKVIDCVGFVSGSSLAARPSKIIAGHEPENTNELLQIMAWCIRKKLSSDEAVEMVLNGRNAKQGRGHETGSSAAKKKESGTEVKDSSSDRRRKHDRSSESLQEKGADRRRRSSSNKHVESTHEASDGKEKPQEEDEPEKQKRRDKKRHKDDDADSMQSAQNEIVNSAEPTENTGSRQATEGAESNSPVTAGRSQRPASAKGQRRRPPHAPRNVDPDGQTVSPNQEIAAPKKLARPPSARPAAPRVRQQTDPSGEERIDSGGQQRSAPIIVDRDLDTSPSSDEDAQFVVEEETNALDFEKPAPISNGIAEDDDDEEHGGLVKKILQTKKELEYSAAGQHSVKQHTEIHRSRVTNAQQEKERQMVVKEIEKLRNSVQKLCQSSAPLAKVIDYIQEDMDAMQNELEFWRLENKQHAMKLEEEENITKNNIEPLNVELQELDQNIAAYRNRMAATKSNIMKNDEKIRKMVTAVATQS